MLGNEIIVSPDPRGIFTEGYISGSTVKPGQFVQVKSGVAAVNGRYSYELFNPGTDGDRRQILIVLADQLRGKTAEDAYADGDRIFLYTPAAGEELNAMVKDISGTGDDIAIGQIFIIDTGTGKLIATTGTPESEPFVSLESETDPTTDWLCHVRYTGK